jgi:hypothetical protein
MQDFRYEISDLRLILPACRIGGGPLLCRKPGGKFGRRRSAVPMRAIFSNSKSSYPRIIDNPLRLFLHRTVVAKLQLILSRRDFMNSFKRIALAMFAVAFLVGASVLTSNAQDRRWRNNDNNNYNRSWSRDRQRDWNNNRRYNNDRRYRSNSYRRMSPREYRRLQWRRYQMYRMQNRYNRNNDYRYNRSRDNRYRRNW